MQRRLWVRTLLALWSLWFTAAVTEPAGLFVCAMHSGTAGGQMQGHAHQGMRAAHSGHGRANAHASHGNAATVSANNEGLASVSEPTPPQSHNCTCLGECCAVSPATLPAPRLQVALGIALIDGASTPPAARTVAPSAQNDHVLPFANGPPRAA